MDPVDRPFEIRNARLDDASALSGLLAELGFATSVDAVEARFEAMSGATDGVLVAARGEETLGLVTIHVTRVLHRPTPVGRLTALVVTEHARGGGVGRALVEAAERLLAERGCGLVELTSNRRLTGAHAFYEKLGYEATSLRFKKSLALPEA